MDTRSFIPPRHGPRKGSASVGDLVWQDGRRQPPPSSATRAPNRSRRSPVYVDTGTKPTLAILGLVLAEMAVLAGTSTGPVAARDEPQRIREIVELRDATSKTYDLGEGKRE